MPSHSPAVPVVKTSRLVLRGWTDDDREPFASLNCDPEVTRYLGPAMSRTESDALVDRMMAEWQAEGHGLWAVVPLEGGECIGFVGLHVAAFEAAFTPCVEVGWRLARSAWGRGYAPEAASAAALYGFDKCGLDEIVSFTAETNTKSRRVMEKLGMTHDPTEDFDHPNVGEDDPLRRHVLYRLRREHFVCR
jgi:RimJ/RimL family protein N-acetyltransferase